MDAPPPPSQGPQPFARVILGVGIVLFGAWALGPAVLLLAVVAAVAMFIGAAVALQHTDGLADAATFASAHWTGLSLLLATLAIAYVHRASAGSRVGVAATLTRSPMLTLAIALPILTAVVLRLAWDAVGFGLLAGALLAADVYFFTALVFFVLVTLGVRVTRRFHAWSVATRYRSGLVTGVLGVALIPLAVLRLYSPEATKPQANVPTWKSLTGAFEDQRPLEKVRRLMLKVAADRPALEPAPPATQTAPTSPSVMASVATGFEVIPDNAESIRECLRELHREAEDVQRSLQSKFRVPSQDAYDFTYEALLYVCERHAVRKYPKPGAVLQLAARQEAIDNWRRRKKIDWSFVDFDNLPCSTSPDEFEKVAEILQGMRAQEKPETLSVIHLHIWDGLTFAAIDGIMGTRNAAKDAYWNAMRRTRKRLEKCGI